MTEEKTYYWNVFKNWKTNKLLCENNEMTTLEQVYEDILSCPQLGYVHTLVEYPNGTMGKLKLQDDAHKWEDEKEDRHAWEESMKLSSSQLV